MNNPILVVMAKEPLVGSTKTRLCPPLTFAEAAGLYEALLLDTLDLCASLDEIDLAIAVTPPESTEYFERVRPQNALILPVGCVDIGDCLTQVFGELLRRGYPKAMAFNSDGPSLPPEFIHKAARLLDDNDLVLGPGEDGGYYLVGLKRLHETIFRDIEWSTSRVLSQTLARAEAERLSIALLPQWYDIDTAENITRLQAELARLPANQLTHTRNYLVENLPDLELR